MQTRIDFEVLNYGMLIKFWHEDREIIFDATGNWSDSILDLVRAISAIVSDHSFASVKWYSIPEVVEFQFEGNGDTLRLQILHYKDVLSPQNSSVFELMASRNELCIVFWRGIRRLQTSSSETYLKAWRHPFPTEDVDLLTEQIVALKGLTI